MNYHETPIKVRFNEIDAYHVAWHGHYVAWMEVGRGELAGLFGLNADQLAKEGYLAPVITLELNYRKPLRPAEEARILTTLRRTEAATLEFDSRILGADGSLAATGKTVHALTDLDWVLQYRIPRVIEERLARLLSHLEAE
jgi:acyl-CoA thioester hydrolase